MQPVRLNMLTVLLMTAFVVLISARRIEHLNLTVKKGLSVGTGTNDQVDSAAWVEIGADSSTRASILLHGTDIAVLDTNHLEFGTMHLQLTDSGIYINMGADSFRRLAWADEI